MGPLAIAIWLVALSISACTADWTTYDPALDNGTYGAYPVRRYMTEGDITSPRLNRLQSDPACDDGLLTFLTPKGNFMENPGPMILDNRGELIWAQYFDNAFGGQAYGLRVQQYQGDDYLTFWLGDDMVLGHGAGAYYMLNSSYDVVHTVRAAGGFDADLHELLITPRGTALITVYDRYFYNLTAYRTFGEVVDDDTRPHFIWDCLIQEVSLHTGKLLFQWRASDHIPLSETYRDILEEGIYGHPWDWYHLNSIEKDDLGNYLVSARFSFSLLYIDGKTGDIIWRLGGKKNDFEDLSGESLLYAWQHDARFHDANAFPGFYTPPPARHGIETRLVSLFDNGRDERPSQGLLLEITYPLQRPVGNTTDYTVRTIMTYDNPARIQSTSQGSMQVLAGEQPKVLLGYGYNPVWTEYNIDGTILCDVHFGAQSSFESGDIQSYRVQKYAWKGMPRTSPKIEHSDDGLSIFASWNGATEVRTWIVQAAEEAEIDEHWKEIARMSSQGFETVMMPPIRRFRTKRYLRVLALDQYGNTLPHGVSESLDRGEVDVDILTMASDYLIEQLESWLAKSFVFLVVLVFLGTIGFRLLKQWQILRYGRAGGSPIRWKRSTIRLGTRGDV